MKPRPGDPINFSARDWAKSLDAGDQTAMTARDQPLADLRHADRNGHLIKLLNGSGAQIKAGDWISIVAQPWIDPGASAESALNWRKGPLLLAAAKGEPQVADTYYHHTLGRIACALQPAANGYFFWGQLCGAFRTKILALSPAHRYAWLPPNKTQLETTDACVAPAEILWMDDWDAFGASHPGYPAEKWAIVLLGQAKTHAGYYSQMPPAPDSSFLGPYVYSTDDSLFLQRSGVQELMIPSTSPYRQFRDSTTYPEHSGGIVSPGFYRFAMRLQTKSGECAESRLRVYRRHADYPLSGGELIETFYRAHPRKPSSLAGYLDDWHCEFWVRLEWGQLVYAVLDATETYATNPDPAWGGWPRLHNAKLMMEIIHPTGYDPDPDPGPPPDPPPPTEALSVTGSPSPDCTTANTGEPFNEFNGQNRWVWTAGGYTWELFFDGLYTWVLSDGVGVYYWQRSTLAGSYTPMGSASGNPVVSEL